MAGDFERLAYEAALRGLDKQESLLDEMRTRANTLLAVSSLAVSVLGQEAFRSANSKALTVVALAAFAVSVAASVFVLLPKKQLVFAEAGVRVYEDLYQWRDSMPRVYRQLAYDLARFWATNDSQITLLSRAYTLAVAASVLELLLLTVLTGGNVLYS